MANGEARDAIIRLRIDKRQLDEGPAAVRKALAKMERERVSAEKRVQRDIARAAAKGAKDAERARAKAAKAAEKEAKDRRKAAEKRGSFVSSAVGGFAGGVGAAVTGKVFGAMEDAASEVLNVERAMTRLQIAGGRTGEQMGKFRTELNNASKDTGIARGDLLEGAAAYVRLTGDAQGAQDNLALFSKVAAASGAQMDDIASTAAALKQNLQINPRDFQTGFDILISQGKAGAVELNEMAQLMAGIAPTFAKFRGGTGIEGMKQLGAGLQIARQGFGTSAEAVTGMRNFIVAIQRNSDKFKAAGVKIFSKDKKGVKRLRDFRSIVQDIGNSKLANDPGKLQKAFGSDEAQRFFDIINRGLADYDQLVAAGGGDAVNKDSLAYLASDAGKIDVAINSAKMALVEAFTPDRIKAFASALGDAAKTFADMVHFAQWLMGESEAQKGLKAYDERYAKMALKARGIAATDENVAEFNKLQEMAKSKNDFQRVAGEVGLQSKFGRGAITTAERQGMNEQIQRENRHGYMMADDAPLVMTLKDLADHRQYAIAGSTNEQALMERYWKAFNREFAKSVKLTIPVVIDAEPVAKAVKGAKGPNRGSAGGARR